MFAPDCRCPGRLVGGRRSSRPPRRSQRPIRQEVGTERSEYENQPGAVARHATLRAWSLGRTTEAPGSLRRSFARGRSASERHSRSQRASEQRSSNPPGGPRTQASCRIDSTALRTGSGQPAARDSDRRNRQGGETRAAPSGRELVANTGTGDDAGSRQHERRRVRAVVHQEQQTIHLIGYASEAELVQAVKSFRRVPAESD